MKYSVVIQPSAFDELDAAYTWIAERSPERALGWYAGFIDALESLASFPFRCGMALEDGCIPVELRQLIYGKRDGRYRALYFVRDYVVRIVHIRHASRNPANRADLRGWDIE